MAFEQVVASRVLDYQREMCRGQVARLTIQQRAADAEQILRIGKFRGGSADLSFDVANSGTGERLDNRKGPEQPAILARKAGLFLM